MTTASPSLAALAEAVAVAPLYNGSRGPAVVALQWALARLGHFGSLVDGDFGPRTDAALRAFCAAAGLAPSGTVDAATLAALDRALVAYDPAVPAAKAPDPVEYLRAQARAVSVGLTPGTSPRWNAEETQRAFGRFVAAVWPTLKANRVESDCKTLALVFMDLFRSHFEHAAGAGLGRPGRGGKELAKLDWTAITAKRPGGYFSSPKGRAPRPGYEAATRVAEVDPAFSMIFGVNLAVDAHTCASVARHATVVVDWSAGRDNRGDRTRAELPVAELTPGRLIFMDHQGDGQFDHAITVVANEPSGGGARRTVVLAVGSFDDVKDADSATKPGGRHDVNHYAEEVTIELEGDAVRRAACTWASQPAAVAAPSYGATNTIMDLHAGSRLVVAQWGDP